MIVLDCCAAVEIARKTTLGKAYQCLMLKNEAVVASTLFQAEVANTYWKYVRAGLLSLDDAREYVARTIDLVDEFYGFEDYVDEVFAEAAHMDYSVYDLFYMVLARRHAATLFTADRKLIELCEQMHVNCMCGIDF